MRLLLALALTLALPLTAAAQSLSFALLGDTPYSRWEREQLPLMLTHMAQQGARFALHVGDIKSGSSLCSDEVLQDILGLFQAAPLPLVYTPGDNEWTDCHRRSNGGYDPQERLQHLRTLFFADDYSLGQPPLRLQRQSQDPGYAAYRENQRWEQDGVLFITLNVPGSHNNYHGPLGHGGPVAEFLARSAANHDWLMQGFELARQRRLAGVLIAMQGNPGLETASMGRPRLGYRKLIEDLQQQTQAYAGQVLLVHGDTHIFQHDQPLMDVSGHKMLPNFTRIEVPGYPFMGWVQVTLEPNAARLFRVQLRHHPPPATSFSP